MHRISRQALFDMAWTRPLTQVAADFGVTSTALKKTCDRHDIPTPSRGYWAQVAAGRTFRRPKLRPARSSDLEEVRIVGAPALPEPVRQAVDSAKARSKAFVPKPAETLTAVEPPMVRDLRKALAKAKPDEVGFVYLKGQGRTPITAGPETAERALTWLSQFLALARAEGFNLDRTGETARLVIEGQPIAFRLEEKTDKILHEPTPKELAEKARRADWGYSASWTPWPKYDHRPSGRLSLVIDENIYSGLRKTFADGKTQTLEGMTAEILAAFSGHAAMIIERQRQADETRRRAEVEQARRERLRAFEAREGRRMKFVEAVAAAITERDKLKVVLEHLQAVSDGGAGGPHGMAAWLERRIAQQEALLSAGFMEISCRYAKVAFDEARPITEPSWAYPSAIELHLWTSDPESDKAYARSGLEWAVASGWLADPVDLPEPPVV